MENITKNLEKNISGALKTKLEKELMFWKLNTLLPFVLD